jgi:hypothetical protein
MPKAMPAHPDVVIPREARRLFDWRLVLLLLGAAVYLYCNLFFPPNTPILLGGDQVYFWTYAERMMDGERIYRDFFQFTPPGTDLVYLGLFQLLGPTVWVTNATVLGLGVALCWLCFALASEIMQPRYAMLATIFFLVVVYGKSLNATHHWFSVLAIMGAIKVYTAETSAARTLGAGTLLGLASFFTQTHGAVALIAFVVCLLLTWWRSKGSWVGWLQSEALLLLGYAVALLLLSAPFIAAIGLRQLWYFQVTFVRQYAVHASQGAYLGLPESLSWHSLLSLCQYLVVYILLLVSYPLSLWRCWRERHNPSSPWERVALLSMVGLSLLVEVAFSMNWLRVFAVSFAGVILLFWNADRAGVTRRYAVVLLWVALACVGVRQTMATYMHAHATIRLRGGNVITTPQASEKLRWLMLHTTPGEFFLQADWPGMYLPLRLRNPLFVDAITPGEETRSEDVASAIQQLERNRVQYILWPPRLESTASSKDTVSPLRTYLHLNYTQVHTFADGDMIWERNEFVSHPVRTNFQKFSRITNPGAPYLACFSRDVGFHYGYLRRSPW